MPLAQLNLKLPPAVLAQWRALAAAGTTTKTGNPWSPSTVKLALERLGLVG